MSNPRQGEIHYVDLPDKGGLHYVMVVPETKSNWTRMTLVAPFTSHNIARHLADDKGAFFPAGSRPFLGLSGCYLSGCALRSFAGMAATLIAVAVMLTAAFTLARLRDAGRQFDRM